MVTHPQLVRVSCAALCRIEHQGSFLLMVNRNRIGKGLGCLSPVGGALRHDPGALAHFNPLYEEDSGELRLLLETRHWDDFREWFFARQDRELSPFRELHEELVLESGIVPDLVEAHIALTYLRTVEKQRLTDRTNRTGMLTRYLWEIFDVQFLVPGLLRQLLAVGRTTADHGAVWVPRTQILSNKPVTLTYHNENRRFDIAADMLLSATDEML